MIPIISKIPEIEVRHKGMYDLDTIYKSIRHWFREREYDYNEDRYKDKVADIGNELEVNMSAEIRINDFVQFNIKLESKFYGVKEFEADYMGSKRKVNNGQFYIKLSGFVTYDYQKKFNTKMTEFFLELLVKKILKNYFDVKYEDRLYYEIYGLQTLIKEQIYMETATNAY